MSVSVVIHPGSSVPVYRQITEQVRLAVATGRLAVAEQLPSVRALAEQLVVNPNTVARAYADLAREGLIETRQGRGVFVIPKRRVFHAAEGRRRLEPLLNSLLSEALALDVSPEDLQEAFEKKLAEWRQQRKAKS